MKQVYKIGTDFGPKHIFKIFKKHGIVFVGDETESKTWKNKLEHIREGDVILVCEGQQCAAIAEVKTPAADIRLFSLQTDSDIQEIMAEDISVIGCKVNFYVLDEEDAEGYIYQKRGRFCCINKTEIKDKAVSLLHKYQADTRGGIFNWATSELSQDAILCWIFDSICHHTIIEPIARGLLDKMGIPMDAEVTEMSIYRQYCRADIVLSFKYDGELKVIIIEDKINAAVYNNIASYCKQILRWGLPNGERPTAEQITPCILRTGDGNERKESDSVSYPIINRRDILHILQEHPTSVQQSDILKGFMEMLTMQEERYQSFATKNGTLMNREILTTEAWSPWKGFYDKLLKESIIREWNYVANASGGFLCGNAYEFGIWDNQGHRLYMQFNSVSKNLCLMIGEVVKNHSDMRMEMVNKLSAYKQTNGNISDLWEKPSRYGSGCYMVYAVMPMDKWLKDTWDETQYFLQEVKKWHRDFTEWILKAE